MTTLRAYDIGRVLGLKEKILHDSQVVGFFYTQPTGNDFGDFVNAVHKCLPKPIERDHVYQSLNYLAGQELTGDVLDEVAWRLAGNTRRLLLGQPVLPWNRQRLVEWVPLHILSAELFVTRKRQLAVTYTCQVLAGTSCPLAIEKFWTRKFINALVAQRLGFSKPWQNYPFRDVFELVNMRFYALIEPKLSKTRPGFERIEIPPSCWKWNRNYLVMRTRSKPREFTCPRNYPRSTLCHLCPAGLEECPAAVHERSFVVRYCDRCGKDAWFNPEFPDRPFCVDCQRKELFKGK